MAGALPIDAELSAALARAQQVPQPANKLAIQLARVQLRLWVADENDVACRPWYIIALELYPRGKVTNQTISKPASQRPDARAMLSFLLEHITSPPPGDLRQRPTNVSLVDAADVEKIRPALSKLKIQCECLTLADGLDDYVRKFSDKLVSLDRAARSDAAERPGLLSAPDVTVPLARNLFSAAVAMHRAAPWAAISDSLALAVRLSRIAGAAHRPRFYATILGGEGGSVLGVALMPTLASLRAKFRRATGLPPVCKVPGGSATAPAFDADAVLCAACGQRVVDAPDAGGERFVLRCAGCKKVVYCDEECQRKDWRTRHRFECEKARGDEAFVFTRKEWQWLNRELALLFVDPTAMPFDDLDAVELHGFPAVESSPPLYPFAFVTVISGDGGMQKRVERPNAREIAALTQVATALTECVAPPPEDCTLHLANGVSVAVAEDLKRTCVK